MCCIKSVTEFTRAELYWLKTFEPSLPHIWSWFIHSCLLGIAHISYTRLRVKGQRGGGQEVAQPAARHTQTSPACEAASSSVPDFYPIAHFRHDVYRCVFLSVSGQVYSVYTKCSWETRGSCTSWSQDAYSWLINTQFISRTAPPVKSLLCSPKLRLLDRKFSKTVKYYYNVNHQFSMWIYSKV